MKPVLPALIAGLFPLAAMAQGPVSADGAYIRATNPKSGAAYMAIRNDGTQTCTLMAVTTRAAAKAELHGTREEGGMMRMIAIGPVDIGPGETLALAPGGDHLMLMGLIAPLKNGDRAALMLDMGDCGLLQVGATVDNGRKPGQGTDADADADAGNGAMSH